MIQSASHSFFNLLSQQTAEIDAQRPMRTIFNPVNQIFIGAEFIIIKQRENNFSGR